MSCSSARPRLLKIGVVTRVSAAWALAIALLVARTVAQSDCHGSWLSGESLPGIDGVVICSCRWDPDGAGPSRELIVFAGRFTTAGGNVVSNVVAWDGLDWETFGAGTHGFVRAVTIYQGAPTVAVSDLDSEYVERWDGRAWQHLGADFNSAIESLTVYDGELIAGGWFAAVGTVTAQGLARWDGSAWSEFADGVAPQTPGFLTPVMALHAHDGSLFIGGAFGFAGGVAARNIARWDGSAWHPLSIGANNWVRDMTSHNGQLAVAGDFTNIGGVQAGAIALWDGMNWTSPNGGVTGENAFMHCIASFDGELYAGGLIFNFFQNLRYLVKWNGSAWVSPGGGMNDVVFTLTATSDTLFAGGRFTIAGDTGSNGVSRWDGTTWLPFNSGISDQVHAVERFDGAIVIGGEFIQAGDAAAASIARRVDDHWEPMGSGVDGPVHDLTTFRGDLIACGNFHTDGGWNVAAWDGTAWRALGSGLNDKVGTATCMTIFQGDLIVGGYVLLGSGLSAANVARWDGESWSAMGTGFDAFADGAEALIVHKGRLIAAGVDVSRPVVAEWDGQRWQELEGLAQSNGYDAVRALAVYQGDLIAAGDFMRPKGIAGGDVARWDGQQWHSMAAGTASGVGPFDGAWSLAVVGGRLLCGGDFQSIDNIPANNIAQWDGRRWTPLAGGVRGGEQVVRQLMRIGNTLYAAGGLTIADEHVSAYLARWQMSGSCVGDIVPEGGDGAVNSDDLLAVILAWGACPTPPESCSADTNNDGAVNADDLILVIQHSSV